MMAYAFVAVFLAGTGWKTVRLWRRHLRREAFVAVLLSLAAAGYLIPATGRMMPTAASLTAGLYEPLYTFVSRLLGIEEAIP
ncbi:hypothetical protein [Paenibacillus sp. GCM10023250]|uniref:hypothetical protein n=1 Tax=Paenibacillus sp. GCM10023250 TaxID=3252648 RepID=UPI003607547B